MNTSKLTRWLIEGACLLSLAACTSSQATTQPVEEGTITFPSQTPEVSPPATPLSTDGPAVGTPTLSSSPTSDACKNPYSPVVAGASWGYKLTGPLPDTFTHVILSVESHGFLEQDQFGSGVTRQGRWQCDNGNLIALNPPTGNSTNVSAEGVSVEFETKALSGVTIPASINVGDTWTQSLTLEGTQTINGVSYPARNQLTSACTAIGREAVTVDAGNFNALRVECQTEMNISVTVDPGNPIVNTLSLTGSNWYVENIGLVKTSTSSAGFDSTTELVYYTIPQY